MYVLTDPDLISDAELVTQVRRAIEGGAAMVQYRDKRSAPDVHLQHARALRAVTRDLGALFIVNDDPELAAEVDADGVHLGRDDPDVAAARRILGNRIIGVSCYNQLDLAAAAEVAGADYVAFGSFYPSRTKTGTATATLDLLHRARKALHLPIVAIGGITPENSRPLVEAGADALAVAGGVFGADDPRAAAAEFMTILKASST